MNTPDGEEFNIERFVERRRSLRDEYVTEYRDHHREIMENFRPRRGFFLRDGSHGHNGSKVDGGKVNQAIIGSVPIRVSKNAQSGLQAGVTSPSRPWKKLGPQSLDALRIPGARRFYDQLDDEMDTVFAQSNWYRSTHTAYADFVDVGVAALQIDEHPDSTIWCQVHPIGSWCATTNRDGLVDVFYRDYKVTGYEMRQRFENLPERILTMIKKQPFKRHEIYNAIEPNPFYQEGSPAIGLAAFKYLSVWWLKGETKDFLKITGYHEFPVMVFRMSRSENGDAYGYGLGTDALGEAKQYYHQNRVKLRVYDYSVQPPLQAPTELASQGLDWSPFGVNYHDGNPVTNLFQLNLPVQFLLQDILQVSQELSSAYFEDLFLMITNGVSRQTTAREIEERHEEKLVMLGPVLESLNYELLDPSIDRVIGIMRRAGRVPEAPPELAGTEIRVEYISILAQAQRAVRTVAIEQGVNFTAGLAQLVPEALDRINVDGTVDEYWERIGFPAAGIRSIRDAEAIRTQRAQAAQQAQQLEQAQIASQAAGNVGLTADQVQPNVLQQLLGGAGG